ncbi:degenerate transposase [Streptococcus pneumoniae]|nr:degenerate transposase [Streptococcus pneumoniae]VND87492.1 degenerate transposase [Streptococcus pneumoniae]VSU48515.1 degenerate transposase [Streptococcus pneumoniae]
MMVAETSIVKKNHQIPRIINQKIAQKLIEKNSMTDIAHQLAISTSTVIRKLNDFHFECNFRNLPEIMSWDEHKLSFEITFFATIEPVRCRVKIITMDMFSPYYDLAKQLRFQISRLRLKQSPRLFHSRMLKSFLIAFTLYNILAVL